MTSCFNKKLILWYLEFGRELPWRKTKEPYAIWLSEIILQQTRVAQGLPYYLRFIETFPTVKALAEAQEEQVLKLWQGLGYYTRARNLHSTAKYISSKLNNEFPTTYTRLLKLKGVGDYTASAIGSICFNLPTAVVDGNVYRVLARYFGIFTPINSSLGVKEFKILAQSLIDVSVPGIYNQAIMEFGARHCKPQNPDCNSCIFNDSCMALQNKKISELPVKLKKNKIKNLYFNYLVIISEDNKTILQQRTKKGIWQQLYEFPLIETATEIEINQLKMLKKFKEFSEKHVITSVSLYNNKSIVHKLSHQHLYTRFWIAETVKSNLDYSCIKTVKKYPVPVLISNFIDLFFESKSLSQKQKK